MKNLAIVLSKKPGISETFFNNHINTLPFNVTVIYGNDVLPYFTDREEIRAQRIIQLIFRFFDFFSSSKNSYQKYRFKRALKKNKIDIVLSEYLTTTTSIYEICNEMKIPYVATALGYDISVNKVLKTNAKKYKAIFDSCKKIIIVSNHMRDNLSVLGCPAEKIIYSPAGPEESFFNLSPDFNNSHVIAVGRFVDKKAPYLTILAFQLVLEQFPEAKLTIAGSGELYGVCQDIVNSLNLSESIDLIGEIDQQKQKELLQSSCIFIQHSKVAISGDSEGTPVAILEASAAGLPVVSTLHAGIPEVILHETTGYLVKEGDIIQMAEYIIMLLRDKKKAIEMGSKGREFVKNNFSLKHHINSIANALNE